MDLCKNNSDSIFAQKLNTYGIFDILINSKITKMSDWKKVCKSLHI